jgi:hypothetical protein
VKREKPSFALGFSFASLLTVQAFHNLPAFHTFQRLSRQIVRQPQNDQNGAASLFGRISQFSHSRTAISPFEAAAAGDAARASGDAWSSFTAP